MPANPVPIVVDNADSRSPERVQQALRELPPEFADDFQRLSRRLVHGPQFQWLLVEAPAESVRGRVMAALERVLRAAGLRSSILPLTARIADVPALERRLVRHAANSQVVHVVARPGWFDTARWDAFNLRRERIAAHARARLVFWLDGDAIEQASRSAPDLWAWRGGVYSFGAPAATRTASVNVELQPLRGAGSRSTPAERQRRIEEIRRWLASDPPPPDDLLVAPLDELGRLLADSGDRNAALSHWRDVELPFHRRRGDRRATAVTLAAIAGALQQRGELDEALRMLREDVLPLLGTDDEGLRAEVQDHIADVLTARASYDEALQMRRELLSLFARRGQWRDWAREQSKLAELLKASDQLDAAMKAYRDEALPVFERLGDAHAEAVVQGRIADLLVDLGRPDEALRLYREAVLPAFERLGDAEGRALTRLRIGKLLLRRDPRGARRLFEQVDADLRALDAPRSIWLFAEVAEGLRELDAQAH